MKVILASILLVLISVLLLGVKALFVKGGKFPSHHHHHHGGAGRRGRS